MTITEFEQLNANADKIVTSFSKEYAGKFCFLKAGSSQTKQVLGLSKFLATNNKVPSSLPFTDKTKISRDEISKATLIVYMVEFVDDKQSVMFERFLLLNAPSKI